MLGRLNHVAIAVPDLDVAIAQYADKLNANVSKRQRLEEHGVTVVFIELPNSKIELLEAIDDTSPIASFMERNPKGGMHHICYEVDDIIKARDHLIEQGAKILGGGEPKSVRMENQCCSYILKILPER